MRAAGLFLLAVSGITWAAWEAGRPRWLSNHQTTEVARRVDITYLLAKHTYGLHQNAPVVKWGLRPGDFGFRDPKAVTRCGFPQAEIIFSESHALINWYFLIDVTIPHEVAHLVLCELDPSHNDHSEVWLDVAIELGMET